MRATRAIGSSSRRGRASTVAVGTFFVVPRSWSEDYPELAEWVGANAYWKVVHTSGFEPLVTLESRVRAERIEFSRARFLELSDKFRLDNSTNLPEDFWNLLHAVMHTW